jgi:hypothetical protein
MSRAWKSQVRGWPIRSSWWWRHFGPVFIKLGRRRNAGEDVVNWMQKLRKTGIMPNCACRHAKN